MDKNTNKRIVVMDREQFDILRSHAYHGAHEDGLVESFETALRHVHKFNPHVESEDDGEAFHRLIFYRQQAQLARHWQGFDTTRTVYLPGEFHRLTGCPQSYLMPVKVVGRADLGGHGIVVEFQTHDDYQREAFLACMRIGRTYPRCRTHRFNGHPVPGGDGIFFDGSWSRRQHGRLLRGAVPKLYFATEASKLVESVPDGYQPASGLFQGMYFLPT